MKSIDLTSTDFSNWSSLLALLSKSSLLASLMLARNRISKLYLPSTGTNNFEASQLLPSLHSIGLAANSFEDWHMADQLARFPSLREVTLSECPVMLKSSNETARQELIARMPMVTVLNRLEVMADEKRGAELDYLKRYGTQWRAAGGDIDSDTGAFCAGNSAFNQLHPAYARLCAKYGPPEVGECKVCTKFSQNPNFLPILIISLSDILTIKNNELVMIELSIYAFPRFQFRIWMEEICKMASL
ncbi:unnamed protein product [Protopolystoma xenopodis]|uniref:Tubulin-specific chaperone E n=1 Tax=Protopolystoma xenopodis TaxID=117903 RepID=A0A3S5FBW7_9PLAT|nr:unnamed protein product [Protopolystoma xenopodis]